MAVAKSIDKYHANEVLVVMCYGVSGGGGVVHGVRVCVNFSTLMRQ